MRRAAVVLLLAFTACSRLTAPTPGDGPTTDPAALQEFLDSRRDAGVPKDPKIGPGDVIRVDVKDAEEASREYTVSRKGTIRLPFVGEAQVGGKSPEEAAEEIARRMSSVIVDAAAEVELIGSVGGEATIEGAVERPGKVRLGTKGKTLLEAIAASGGLSADAAGVIRITPASSVPEGLFAEEPPAGFQEDEIEIATSDVLRAGGTAKLYLRPGDRIHVVSQGAVEVASVPDPLVELGLPTEDLSADEEREERPVRRRAKARESANEDDEAEPEAASAPALEPTPEREAPRPKERIVERVVTVDSGESERLRSELEVLRKRVEAGESRVVKSDSDESERLHSELEALRKRVEEGESRVVKTDSDESERLRSELEVLRKRVEAGETRVVKTDSDESERLRADLEALRKRVEAGESRVVKSDSDESERLRAELQVLRQRVEANEARVVKADSGESERLRAELEVLRKRVAASESRRSEAETEKLAELNRRITDLEALRKRVEENEVVLRNQTRRAEGESSQRQKELEQARAEAENARRREAAERQRAAELTRRIMQIEASRGGPAVAAEPLPAAAVERRSDAAVEPESESEPASATETETIVLRRESVAPVPTPEAEGRSGGLFGWFGGDSDDADEAPPPLVPIVPPPNEPPPREVAVYAPPRRPLQPVPAPAPPARVVAPSRSSPAPPPPAPPARVVAVAPAPAPAPAARLAPDGEARIGVSGRVITPGDQRLAESRTITRALQRAGISADADVSRIEVRRGGGRWRIVVNLREVRSGRSPDLMLEDGDVVVVP